MKNVLRSLLLAATVCAAPISLASAQTQPTETKEAAYTRTITERADKIVAKIDGLEAKRTTPVRDVIVDQYRALNDIHEKHSAELKELKAKPKGEDNKADLQKLDAQTTAALDKQHKKYIGKLSKYLTAAQIDQVKDGMTYGVLPITYRGYQDMLPNLTEAQKAQILAWLTEARDHAMDAGSSKEKHAWFGKYKGRINNYLSAAGIDLKQAGQDWEARRAASQADKTAQ